MGVLTLEKYVSSRYTSPAYFSLYMSGNHSGTIFSQRTPSMPDLYSPSVSPVVSTSEMSTTVSPITSGSRGSSAKQ